MFGINKRFCTLLAGIAATCLIGYCVFFDYKRCTAHDYRKKIRERRQQNRNKALDNFDTTNCSDQEQLKRYFIYELRLSDGLVARGDIEKGVDHLVNATVASGRPNRMLELIQKTMPPHIIELFLRKMQQISARPATHGVDAMSVDAKFCGYPLYVMSQTE